MATKSDNKKKISANKAAQTAFLEALVQRKANISAACQLSGVSRSEVYEWKERDPEFLKLYKQTRKQLEEFLFEKACEHGEMGDSTLLIFSLKALNRARFDDQFIKQKYAMDRGAQPDGSASAQVRAVLVREEEPWKAKVDDKPYVDPEE
jgi:hypothetical protein